MPARKIKAVDNEEAKKEEAWDRLISVLDRVHKKIRQAGISPEQAERDALEMVRRFREKKYAKSKKSSET